MVSRLLPRLNPAAGLVGRKAYIRGGRKDPGKVVMFHLKRFPPRYGTECFAYWSEEVAQTLTRKSGLEELTSAHWKVLRFFRDYYANQGRAPMNRHIWQGTGLSLGEVESLFPRGIRLGARMLAGLPNPTTY